MEAAIRMITNTVEFRRELEKVDEWWLTGAVKETVLYPFKRESFTEVEKEIQSRRALLLLGPRRVGKSVLLRQMIHSLIEKGAPPSSILYYSLDDPSLSAYSNNLIKDLIDYHEEVYTGGKRFIFLDEVQAFPGWHKWIKAYYDRNLPIKFILSGSSSLLLQKEANQYLRGRTREFYLYPLNFAEFLQLSKFELNNFQTKNLYEIDLPKVNHLSKKIRPFFEEYLLVGGFPEWFQFKPLGHEAWFDSLINDVPKKAIYEDIANLYNIKNPRFLELILTFIISHQSQILSYETINEVAGLDRATLVNYIEFLKASYLLIEILKFAKLKEQMKAKKKFLAIDQGLRNAILKDYQVKEENAGFMIENLIGVKCFQHKASRVFYWRNNGEIDFILQNKETIPVEVKYKRHIKQEDLTAFLDFLNEKEISKGIIITRELYQKQVIGKKNLYFVPAWLFLLQN